MINLAWGVLTPQQVQKVAELSLEDHKKAVEANAELPELNRLARAGTSGTESCNVHRDIMRIVKNDPMLKPTKCTLPYVDPIGERPSTVMLPHEMFHDMYTHYPDSFTKNMVPGGCEELQKFWGDVGGRPQLEGHPIKGRMGWKRKAVPIGIHGDEVPVVGVGKVWAKVFLTFQWYSLMAAATARSTTDLMMWIWGVWERFCIPGELGTIDSFMVILVWSLHALFLGKWPSHDWRGVQTYGLH